MKPIKLDEELQKTMLEEFKAYLTNNKFTGTEVSFKQDFGKLLKTENLDKPIIMITAAAWVKMQTLVQMSTGEIGWHGLVTRKDNIYLITDIILYPQMVTAATVTTDTDAYGSWICNLPADVCNKVRFQGHSHVHMGTTPSGVDTAYYQDLLSLLRKDEYYIFMILNKKHEFNIYLYDLATNAIYETKDIICTVVDQKHKSIPRWADENIKAFCQPRPLAAVPTVITPTGTAGTANNTNTTNSGSKRLVWAYNTLGHLIQMEEQYIDECPSCGAMNARMASVCGKCHLPTYFAEMG